MPRIKLLRFHVYDGKTLTYSGLGERSPMTREEEAAIPAESRETARARDHEYEIATYIDGPRAGEESIVYLAGDNWIPAHWPVRVPGRA